MLSAETHRGNREASGGESYGRFLDNYHRYYDPAIGRYINADPIGQFASVNLFTYAENDPIGKIDPLGLQFDTLTAGCSRGSASACAALGLPPAAAAAAAAANNANQSSGSTFCSSSSSGDDDEEGEDDSPPGPPPLPPRVDPNDLTETVGVPSTPPGAPDPNDPKPSSFFEKAVFIASGIARVVSNFLK